MTHRAPITIITPTYRESGNIKTLVERTFAATNDAEIDAEMIVVDDNSCDGTDVVIAELEQRYPVRLIVRPSERGLSSAVVHGFHHAQHDRFVVIDADLQHPPEMIPDLINQLESPNCDFVISTRYAHGGRVMEEWPAYRRFVSWVAGALAKPLTPLTDPMAGFFAIDRHTWQRAERFNPIGYKIALELYVKCRCHQPAEIPITFHARSTGHSKLTIRLQLQYLRQIIGLYHFRFPWMLYVALIIIVGVVGWFGLSMM